MKNYLIWLLAVTLTLGVACKKEELPEKKVKIEVKKADLPPLNGPTTPIIGDNPFGLPSAHDGIPRNSVHNPVISSTYRYVCSGNAYTHWSCTILPHL